jgi:triosephosphate isomerase (TIM)
VSRPALTIGVSLKMYFGKRQTIDWCRAVAALAGRHPAVTSGAAELFVLPAAPMIDPVLRVFAGLPVGVGAQDLCVADAGAFTGEVSGALLGEMGCRYAEVGHAERRRLFGEDDASAAAKVAACWRNRLTPVLCVGEPRRVPPRDAAAAVVAQAREVLDGATAVLAAAAVPARRVIVAYEPHWAIGRPEPAPVEHITVVAAALRRWLAARRELAGSRVIYGGSAGRGLLTSAGGDVDGLFLGRFAHDPAALAAILDEALAIAAPRDGPGETANSESQATERPVTGRPITERPITERTVPWR